LADALLERAGANSVFLLGTPEGKESSRADNWGNVAVLRRKARVLAMQLSELCRGNIAAVVLHVSGYGYQKRGAPVWLLEGMRIWRQTHRHRRLLGVFHELFATGHPWNSSFWLSNLQKYVTQGIWELCDSGLATTSLYFDQLAAWRPEKKHLLCTMPVFSNVGEPDSFLSTADRPENMAVFGQPGTEHNIYFGPHYDVSASIAKNLNVLKVIDIGARIVAPPDRLGQVPIMALGELSQKCVSRHLMSCRFGLLNYDIGRLEKSGVFAAFAAHGVIPVCIGSHAKLGPGLAAGEHFVQWPLKQPPDFRTVQINLCQWYHNHSIGKHADLIKSLCLSDRVQEA